MFQRIHVYDLDGVLVDTAHRYRNKPDGSIDMAHWAANHTKEKIAQDKLLPLATQYIADNANPEIYTIICTVRCYHPFDVLYIYKYLGAPNKLMMVGQPHDTKKFTKDFILKRRALSQLFNLRQFQKLPRKFWDDNPKNLQACRHLFDSVFHVPSHITGTI